MTNGTDLVSRRSGRDSAWHVNVRLTRSLYAASLCAALALLASSAAGGATASADARSLDTVTIAVIPVEPTAQAAYAQARGFFRNEGIDAKIVTLADPNAIAAAILSGSVQFAAFNIGGVALAKSRGFPLTLVAAGALYHPGAPNAALVSAPGKRFVRPRDLVGKRIGIDQQNTIAHLALLKWLKRGGVSESDVELSEYPFAQMLGPLTHRAIDAAVMPEPYLAMVKQKGGSVVAPIFQSVCATDCLVTAWIARRGIDSALAARFRNAIQAAAAWANKTTNRKASGAILTKYAGIQPSVLKRMARSPFGTRLHTALAQPWIDVYAEFGRIPASFSAGDLIK